MQKKKADWKSEKLALFSQQLQHLLASGIPLIASLELLIDQKVVKAEIGSGLIHSLKQGTSFSQALRIHAFPDLFHSFIRAAEEHGDYVFGLKQCEAYYHSRAKLRQEIIQACSYPLIVLLCVGAALTFMVTVVLPRFAELYETLGVELPAITQYMLALTGMVQWFIWIVAGILAAVLLLWLWSQYGSAQAKPRLEQVLFSLPLIRTFYRFRITHYVAIQLGSLLRSGVPLLTSLQLMEKLSPWSTLRQITTQIKQKVITGISLHLSIKQADASLFLPSLTRMIAIGETSGQLDQSLLSLAKSTEVLLSDQLKRWIRGLEPVLIFLLGVFIAITVIAMFLPMLQMVQAV